MPNLPNADQAILDPQKVTHYLLDVGHIVGGPKARFLMRFGFTPQRPQVLIDALMAHGQTLEATPLPGTATGVKYVLIGPLSSPDGRNPKVRTVWIVRHGETVPRFVTAVSA